MIMITKMLTLTIANTDDNDKENDSNDNESDNDIDNGHDDNNNNNNNNNENFYSHKPLISTRSTCKSISLLYRPSKWTLKESHLIKFLFKSRPWLLP